MKTTKTTTCERCPARVEPGEHLCPACSTELAYRIMSAFPDPVKPHCTVCQAEYSFLEARVLRRAKDPRRGNQTTPNLCWVCARLHLSAQANAGTVPPMS